jgi:hypothetical protein
MELGREGFFSGFLHGRPFFMVFHGQQCASPKRMECGEIKEVL